MLKILLLLFRFAVEIQPTGEVSEYTASLTRKMLKDGKDRITAVKLSLKAEGEVL